MDRDEFKLYKSKLLRAWHALHWKRRYRVSRVAHGWIVEDQATESKVSFHVRVHDARRRMKEVVRLAHDGYFPAPLDKLLEVRGLVECGLRQQEYELSVNCYNNRGRHAKILRQHLKILDAIGEAIEQQITREYPEQGEDHASKKGQEEARNQGGIITRMGFC